MIPKFRAWHIEHKIMCEVLLINFSDWLVRLSWKCDGLSTVTSTIDLNGVVLLQATGLHDKNGVEIFEGDVVTNWQSTGYVVNKAAGHSASVEWKVGSLGFDLLRFAHKYIAIIGNIHKNPELLEQ